MTLEEKKNRVLTHLKWARWFDDNDRKEGEGWRGPTAIGVLALGYRLNLASAKVSPVCQALVRDGLLERKKPGLYRVIQMKEK